MQTTPTELLARLHYSEPAKFPKAAMREIIERRNEMIPHLLAALNLRHGKAPWVVRIAAALARLKPVEIPKWQAGESSSGNWP